MMKKKLSCMAVVSIFIGMGMLASCSVNDNPSKEEVTQKADLVVYGKIFTSEGNQIVEAYAMAEIGTQVDASDDADKFLMEILPAGL